MLGHRNEALKRIGISKLRLMAGKSKWCVICEKKLVRPPDGNHKCAEHTDWEMIVVDGPNDETIRQHSINRLLDTPDWPDHA